MSKNRFGVDTDGRLVVLGGGESGVGAAILGKVKGMDVFLSDMGEISSKYKAMLDSYAIPYEEGKHTEDKILDADVVVKSPGIPPCAPMVAKIFAKGIPVVSEIEFAGGFTDSRMICITGSNGKTTTTLLTYHVLREAGIDAGLAGNVGKSLALQVAVDPHPVYVIELSSFQLENMYQFKADVAVIMNITPDHMDRYDHKMENYVAAKFRILQNQTPDDAFIYWQEDSVILDKIAEVNPDGRRLPFGIERKPESAAWTENEDVCFSTTEERWDIPRTGLSLPGRHNLYNSMAAGLIASVMKVSPDSIRRSLSDFKAVEHRLEYVATVDGVRYVNDSKATNVDSTWYALESMTTPTVLILGGKDKGNDYSQIEDFVKDKVKTIVCMGLHNEKLLDFFTGKVPVIADTHSLADALAACREYAVAGDTVLLSPCCASFDLFKSYEDRGDRFKAAVKAMV